MTSQYTEQDLVNKAISQMGFAYCPYSKYQVGCAIVTEDGTLFGGSNVENASNSMTICAERSAFVAAISQGHKKFKVVVVATRDGGSCCGACRQFMREFIHPASDTQFIFCIPDGTITRRTNMDELLPFSFGPDNLL